MNTKTLIAAALLSMFPFVAIAQNTKEKEAPVKPAKIEPAQPAKADKPSDKPTEKPETEITLKVGDKAPEIKVDNWVKGTKVESFEPGKVYIVEFWATWCPPCRASIPGLSELAKKHKDVAVIGVAASERKEKDGSDKRLENLKTFVEKQQGAIAYTIAYDSDREMGTPWMKASGQQGIPAAFIVDHTGKIAWIGHPEELETPLNEALKAAKSSDKSSKKKDKKEKEKEAVKGKGG